MTLALYGGSFNPPHNGHVMLARNALEALRPGKLIWMPSGNPPHKALPDSTPSVAHRLALSRLAAEGLPDTEVSDFELIGGARYTIDTVMMLRERYKPDTLWLLMGSDMRDSLGGWYRADDLRRFTEPYTFSREICPVSSTEVRALLAQGLGRENVPPAVWEYIRREELYGCPKP
ncbi:MAG: nicotinate-nicotinamide nucleotide adenylyltransferase [Oscillospiraceae bacterium]|jgi:nicotinate-nucleotide adenylyltransferase|nr:nicotinate-nicotinamide nucleotide adenylyltransferase [Oscillospiraceae bacterium]